MKSHATLLDHVRAVARSFREHVPKLRNRGADISLRGYAQLRENNRYVILVISKMIEAHLEHVDEAPTVSEWRKKSETQHRISRRVVRVLAENEFATLAELSFRCEKFASRESVRNCLADGVDLGLIDKNDKQQFSISDLLVKEMFDRSVMKLRHPDVVEHAHFCAAFDTIEKLQRSARFPRSERHPLNPPPTLSEALEQGLYDSELNDIAKK